MALPAVFFISVLLLIAGCGSGNNSAPSGSNPQPKSAITGKVVDASTKAPIAGTVAVALESGPGDFHLVSRTTADASGSFVFSNVAAGSSYAIVIEAMAAQGALYAPAILVSGNGPFGPGSAIGPGVDVGTIPLSLPAANPSTETLSGVVTSGSTNGAVPIKVIMDFSAFVADFVFVVPNPSPDVAVITGPNCGSTTTDCADFNVITPAVAAFFGVFNPPNTQLQPFDTTAPAYGLQVSAFSPSSGQPDCMPPLQGTGTFNVSPGSVLTIGPIEFTGCQ